MLDIGCWILSLFRISVSHSSFVIRHSSFPLLALFLFCGSLPAFAHLPVMAAATATIEADGKYSLDLTFDVPPFALDVLPQKATDPAMNTWLDGPTNVVARTLDDAKARFQKEFATLADGVPCPVDSLIFPTVDDVERYRDGAPQIRLPAMLMLSLEGRLPAGARSVSFRFPAVMGVVAVSVIRWGQAPAALVANAGEATVPVPLQLLNTNPAAVGSANAAAVQEPGRWLVARQYLELGFKHIVPEGTDHILFVLGLFLLGNRLKPLLLQVTAFTVAHSITLGLSLYGVFRLSPLVVEPLIALSIAFVAVENICTPELKPWRPFVVFGFGLMHGLGFAGVLTSLGLPRKDFATALVTFNAGVELGQLAVITLAFLVVGWWRHRTWYRPRIVVPASALIAATGLFWTVQRVALAVR
jgi:hypothetical protein